MKVYRGAPAAARNYVEAGRCRADDYYLGEGTGLAQRLAVTRGDGAVRELSALSGQGYEAWVAGRDPGTGAPRGRVRSDAHGVRFVEVVVNGPKSWSLAAELHPDIAAAYEGAQDTAAREILAWLGAHATTRVGPRGGQVAVPVEVLEAAVVRHYTSRAGDPHRHLHLQLNARVFAAGKWRGLDTVAFRDSIAALNGIGHAAIVCHPRFRAALAAHGLTLDPDGEITQLAPYVGAFSKRAAQIGGLLERYEAQWRAAHPGQEPGPALRRGWDARAWAQDRPDKVTAVGADELRQRWVAELRALGFRDPGRPVPLGSVLAASVDREAAAAEVVVRLGGARSAWNAADVRGEVEQLLARTGVVTDTAVRGELAEDLTARALALCVRLHEAAVPEHVRALTSPQVLAAESDLTARLATRGAQTPTPATQPARSVDAADPQLDGGQRAAVAALAGTAPLVVLEGAAGAGKTTTLAATRDALAARGRRLLVVTPTRKAAHAASVQLGAAAGSAGWLAWQHGYRWDDTGTWTRVAARPAEAAQLAAGDVLLVDEAGMLDQDTARALLAIADEAGARLALVGDRRQLPAVGRGGVLELAHRYTHPDTRIDLDTVHRFLRHVDGMPVPDEEYAALTLAMRTGTDPGAVFDQLHARGQVQLHATDADRLAALAALAAQQRHDGTAPMVVVDTGEQAAVLSAAIRDRLSAAGVVDDARGVVTTAGQRLGAGDTVITRRNHSRLQVANRDAWTVQRVHRDGSLTVVAPGRGSHRLDPDYVAKHVELGYAVTGYGAQGDTTEVAHLVLGEATAAATAYVGMTRGRYANTVHLVADNLDDAREQWLAAAGRDRADLGPAQAREAAARAAAGYARIRPLDEVIGELRAAWTERDQADRALRRWRPQLAGAEQAAPRVAAADQARHRARAERDRVAGTLITARDRLAAVEQVIAADADRITGELRAAWDAQRPGALADARRIESGVGRLGRGRAAVAAATERLEAWAAAWEPVVGDLHQRRFGLVGFATAHPDNDHITPALAEHARRLAEHDHAGDYGAATTAVTAAEQQHRAATATWHALLDQHERAAGPHDELATPTELARLRERIQHAEHQREAADRRLAALRRDPAITTQADPDNWLTTQHERWRRDHDEQRAAEKRHRDQLIAALTPPTLATTRNRPRPRHQPLTPGRPRWGRDRESCTPTASRTSSTRSALAEAEVTVSPTPKPVERTPHRPKDCP